MHNGRKTNMNTRQPRPAAPFAGCSKWWSPAARPEQNGSHNARRNYERYLAIAQAEAQSGNTVAAENYYEHSGRRPRTQELHRRHRCNDFCYLVEPSSTDRTRTSKKTFSRFRSNGTHLCPPELLSMCIVESSYAPAGTSRVPRIGARVPRIGAFALRECSDATKCRMEN